VEVLCLREGVLLRLWRAEGRKTESNNENAIINLEKVFDESFGLNNGIKGSILNHINK
jgi:hypothetical protein